MTIDPHSPVPVGGSWQRWFAYGQTLEVPDGVHHPSAFSAVLASSPIEVAGRTVVDAGSGAGLITISALARGASRVIALDLDAVALEATRANVAAALGDDGMSRLTLTQSDFSGLAALPADVVLANPPQRPEAILVDLPQEERAIHAVSGVDGLDLIRSILEYADSDEVVTTAAGVLDIARADSPRWPQRRLVTSVIAPLAPVWRLAGASDEDSVNVWCFSR